MGLLKYKEFINTECRVKKPILCVKAIKIDSNVKSLKNTVGCKSLKSCDYFKKNKQKFYFIEVSDFNEQFEDLSSSHTKEDAKKYIKLEIRLKLSDTLLIYQKLQEKFKFKPDNCLLKKKALLAICKEHTRDSIFLDKITRELTKHYCPEHLSSIQLIPYIKLEEVFKKE